MPKKLFMSHSLIIIICAAMVFMPKPAKSNQACSFNLESEAGRNMLSASGMPYEGNLLTNSGFELGTTQGWYWDNNWATGLLIENTEVFSGQYSALVSGRNINTLVYWQRVPVDGNKTYLLAGWAKLKDPKDNGQFLEMYPASAEVDRPYREEEKVAGLADKWQQVILTVETNNSVTLGPALICWVANIDYYVDDLYIGELKPFIKYNGDKEIQIPDEGSPECVVKLEADIVNQFGTRNGLKREEISEWRLKSDCYGVWINNDELHVSPEADVGFIEVEAVMVPKYKGASSTEITQTVQIELLSNGDLRPRARNITISGVVNAGEILHMDYQYYQPNGIEEGDTEINWLYSETKHGNYKVIENASGRTYVITPEHEDHFIKVAVMPKAVDGKVGKTIISDTYLRKPVAPAAQQVKITCEDDISIGSILEGSYIYSDDNEDEEGVSTFRWLYSDDPYGEYIPIPDAVEKTLALTENEIGKFIKFEVTPIADNEPKQGAKALSSWVNGPMYPVADDVTIKKVNNNYLTGNYTYTHPNGIAEGNTICKWYINGVHVGSGTSYDLKDGGNQTITFEVTPVASKAPFQGKAISTSIIISESSSLKRGNGSLGKGSSYQGLVPVPEPVPVAAYEPKVSTAFDLNHWASEEILFVLDNNIMENPEGGNFEPERAVTRADFVLYIVKALSLESLEYTESFKDVTKDDLFAKELQALVNLGVISRADLFYPQRLVSREEICKIIIEGINAVLTQQSSQEAELTKFTDSEEIAPWAIVYVKQAVGLGLLKGVSETEFQPKGVVTRAQTAVILKRMADYIKNKKAGETIGN